MNTYLVTLADSKTGADQRILVRSDNDDNMQEFIESDKVLPTLQISNPVITSITRLRITRPHKTVLTEAVRETV